MFDVDEAQLDARFLLAIFSDPAVWETVADSSVGGTPTSRNRLKEQAFLALEVPVPPPEEQVMLVNLVDRLRSTGNRRKRRRTYMDGLRQSALNYAFAALT